jgi:hypothetical protein
MAATSGSAADFDFFMGIWKCRHRYRLRRLADCRDWIEFEGCCAVRKILGGAGNMDEGDINLPGDRHRGMSLRTWDPEQRRWSIHRFDSRRPGYTFPAVTGGFAKGVGIFYGDDTLNGRPIRVRLLWSPQTGCQTGCRASCQTNGKTDHKSDQSARWEQAFSLDEGNSWETNWTMDFTRL